MERHDEEISALFYPRWDNVFVRRSRASNNRYVSHYLRRIPSDAAGTIRRFLGLDEWMVNQKSGYVFVDLDAYARNVANVKSWCVSNPSQTVMAALQRSTAR